MVFAHPDRQHLAQKRSELNSTTCPLAKAIPANKAVIRAGRLDPSNLLFDQECSTAVSSEMPMLEIALDDLTKAK